MSQHPAVAKYFSDEVEYWSRSDQSAKVSPLIKLFKSWSKKTPKNKKIKVCEIGGAAGQLLFEIGKLDSSLQLYNLEPAEQYKAKQFSKRIHFLHGSILDGDVKKYKFDCLIMRDVLHHLVGKNLKETINNQTIALENLKKMVKNEGPIFIEEMVTQSKIASRFLYFLSNLNHKIGYRNEFWEINPNAIVSFFIPIDLQKKIKYYFPGRQIKFELRDWGNELPSRLVHLGSKNWKAIISIN